MTMLGSRPFKRLVRRRRVDTFLFSVLRRVQYDSFIYSKNRSSLNKTVMSQSKYLKHVYTASLNPKMSGLIS